MKIILDDQESIGLKWEDRVELLQVRWDISVKFTTNYATTMELCGFTLIELKCSDELDQDTKPATQQQRESNPMAFNKSS